MSRNLKKYYRFVIIHFLVICLLFNIHIIADDNDDNIEAAPVPVIRVQKVEPVAFGIPAGCPALVSAVSNELGIPRKQVKYIKANTFVFATDILPCGSAERLLRSANLLKDPNGLHTMALIQVFEELAPPDVPFSPELAASIGQVFSEHIDDGSQYALAREYLDAMAGYIRVLDYELGSPVDDSVVFVVDKYGESIVDSDNPNLAAYVLLQLEKAEPVPVIKVQSVEPVAFGIAAGYPALVAAASSELGIPRKQVKYIETKTFAFTTDILPCGSAERLLPSAKVLKDPNSLYAAALIQVFEELAPPDVPFSPELAASIGQVFSEHIDDDSQYALAREYLDAMAEYIRVLDYELGSPVEDSMVFVVDKYGESIVDSDNPNLAAYVQLRLEKAGG